MTIPVQIGYVFIFAGGVMMPIGLYMIYYGMTGHAPDVLGWIGRRLWNLSMGRIG